MFRSFPHHPGNQHQLEEEPVTTPQAHTPPPSALDESRTLPCEPESAALARKFVRATLLAWGLGHLTDDAALVVSELVGNAVRHSGLPELRVSVALVEPRRFRVAVSDGSSAAPRPRHPADDSESGRGLFLVEAVADRWGTSPERDGGKSVWAELV
jgi:anti-sigma regulatory factor (Ser/Thr protein kinase)